jgi:hypothetical protein
MADWQNPKITSNYITFVDEVKNRDIDAISLQGSALTNAPVGSIKLVRSPVKFQEWNGSAFIERVISVEGGGSGSASAAGARANFGLGTMAIQNSNAISVTGGTTSNLSMSGCSHNGMFSIAAQPGLLGLNVTANGSYAIQVFCPTGSSGILVYGAPSQTALYILQSGTNLPGMTVTGDMRVFIPTALVIPVGADKY